MTDQVTLRPIEPSDQDEFVALARDSIALHRPWIYPPVTADQFVTYLERFDGLTGVGFLVCRRGTGVIVGYVTIGQIMRGPYQRGVLGYGVFAPFAGRGYMAGGLRQVIGHALGPLGLHRLEADIEPANTASRRLVKRLGFRLEGFSPGLIKIDGHWRDYERWAITTEMFTDLDKPT